MALTQTTLSAAITKDDLTIPLTSSTSFLAGQTVKIEHEYMVVNTVPSTTSITVYKRGAEGTIASPHKALAYAVTSAIAADFPSSPWGATVPVPAGVDDVVQYSVNGAIALPTTMRDTNVILNKAGVAAMTLGDPPKSLDGVKMTIASATAQANTVTYTTGFNNGGTTTDVATFGGAVGDNMQIQAANGIWNVLYLRNVTLGAWFLGALALGSMFGASFPGLM
jgi:hypothetical protein